VNGLTCSIFLSICAQRPASRPVEGVKKEKKGKTTEGGQRGEGSESPRANVLCAPTAANDAHTRRGRQRHHVIITPLRFPGAPAKKEKKKKKSFPEKKKKKKKKKRKDGLMWHSWNADVGSAADGQGKRKAHRDGLID